MGEVCWGHFGTVDLRDLSSSRKISVGQNTNIIQYQGSDFSTKNFNGESYALRIHKLLEPIRRKFELNILYL